MTQIKISIKNKIIIYSDSLTSISKLRQDTTTSKLTLETVKILNILATICHEVQIIKVKAHIGIEGNELADALAKKGANLKPMGPEPHIKPGKSQISHEIQTYELETLKLLIKNAKIKSDHIARLISIINKHGVSLVNGNISDIRSLTHMISDQSHLAYNMSKRDNQVVPECRHCPGTKETAEHFIGKCPYFSILRQQTFGTHPITIAQIIKFHGCPKLIKFITKSGRLEEEFVRFYID